MEYMLIELERKINDYYPYPWVTTRPSQGGDATWPPTLGPTTLSVTLAENNMDNSDSSTYPLFRKFCTWCTMY